MGRPLNRWQGFHEATPRAAECIKLTGHRHGQSKDKNAVSATAEKLRHVLTDLFLSDGWLSTGDIRNLEPRRLSLKYQADKKV